MKRSTFGWILALAIVASGCASGPRTAPPFKLPPIVITLPPATPAPAPTPEPPVVRGTIAVEVLNADGAPVPAIVVSLHTGEQLETNRDGYVAFDNLAAGPRHVVIHHGLSDHRPYEFDANIAATPWRVRLARIQPPAPPEPEQPPVPPPPPVVVPPVVVPPPVSSAPLCSMRDSDPLGCVRQVAAIFPQLLQTNTYASCVEFTQRVLEVLGPDWGHVGKTAGESQEVPRGFVPIDVLAGDGLGHSYRITGVSHDAIKHRRTGQVVDLLGNASANSDPDPKIHGPARIQWAPVAPEHWRANNPFIPAVPVR